MPANRLFYSEKMKTTGGKIPTAYRKARTINVYGSLSQVPVAAILAKSLRQALSDFFDQALYPEGYRMPKIVGNSMTVKDKHGKEHDYIALELYQKPLV